VKTLLFGFEPFLGFDENPSERIVAALQGKKVGDNEIFGLVLPVEYGRAGSLLTERVNEVKPDLVIGTGLHPGAPRLEIMKLAANLKSSSEKDNAGGVGGGGRIGEGEPDGIFMSIDAEGLVAHLNSEGVPAMLQLAGDAYICNFSMFVMAELSKKAGFGCGFIHLPLTEDFVSKNPARNAASMSFATMLRGVEAAITYCAGARKR
jgi:pyroglutamyl-peptidase